MISMLWETHIRIANEILHNLRISRSSVEARRLIEGSVTPDKWRDFPHHHGKGGTIRQFILAARRLFLNDELANAYFNLGIALHYVQDSYTSLTSRSRHHAGWERQIEQAYFVDDLKKLVTAAFRNREGLIREYIARLELLSKEIKGKKETIWLATLPGPGLSYWGSRMWGRPNVDLNFALRASLVIAKSVLGPRTCSKLQKELSHVLARHETMLKKTEITFADEIVSLIKRRDELQSRRRKDGTSSALKSFFLILLSKIHNLRAGSRIKKYEAQKHLEKVVRAYRIVVTSLVIPYSNWYDITTPQIDINIVEKELLPLQEASGYFEISENLIKNLIEKGKLPCYLVQGKYLVKKSELAEIL